MSKKTAARKSTAATPRKPAAARKKAAKQPAARKPLATAASGRKPAARTSAAKKSASKKATRSPALPNGWVELDVFDAPAQTPEPTLQEQLEDFITEQVAAGYFDDRTIIRLAAQMYDDMGPKATLQKLAKPILAAARAAHKREQKSWPAITDNTRLDRAFADLEKDGILARQNFWCCGTCGGDAVVDEIARANKRKHTFDGYTYFHEQDTTIAVLGHGLNLGYGTPDFEPKESVAIGLLVVKALRKHGLKPEWSGDLEDHIHVPMNWQRKFTRQIKYTPD